VRVLLTNDDGFEAEGIGALRAALAGSFESVITVAPRLAQAFPIAT
jgi:broad specificity polyphosphatase/5'/3'-nucleotidase SurE